MGSKTGWILATALVLSVVVILIFVWNPPPSPPRDTTAPGFLDLKQVDVPLSELIGYTPSGPGNAGADYQKAVQIEIANHDEINHLGDIERLESLAVAKDASSDPAMKIVQQIYDHVAAGAKKKDMRYAFVFTPKDLKFSYRHRAADNLYRVAVAVHLLHMVHLDREEYAEAEKVLQALMVFGMHLFNERALAQISIEGVAVQTCAVQRLLQLYAKWPEAPRHRLRPLRDCESQLRLISSNFRQKKKILWDNIPANDPVTHEPIISPGDVFNVIENDRDRAWRVQGLVTLGALKFRATGRGDVKKTDDLIAQYKTSDDAILAAAAKCADELTVEQFRHSSDDY